MANSPAPALVLFEGDEFILREWGRASTIKAGLARRARIVLLAADGLANTRIAELTGLSVVTVLKWRSRYAEAGLAGLGDGPRTDRPRQLDHFDLTFTVGGQKRLDPARTNVRPEPVWDRGKHPEAWWAVWQYRRKRAMRDEQTLNLQRNRAISILEGDSQPKSARYVKTKGAKKVFDEKAYDRAMKLSGFKGYVTNIPATIMPAHEVIGRYHDLWHVEQSFRMSKTDLDARPMFHRTRDAIEAYLSVVFTALGVARFMQDATGASVKKIITTLRPLREFTGVIGDQEITFAPDIPPKARELLDALPNSR